VPFIEITLIEGRSADAKRALMKRVTDAVEESIGAPRASIRIVLREVPAFHWAVGGEPKGDPPQ
jgi:4-oxalocrotonate tautomerase